MTPRTQQTLELLLLEERERVERELKGESHTRDEILEESTMGWFQDTEPMTPGEWLDRLGEMEKELIG